MSPQGVTCGRRGGADPCLLEALARAGALRLPGGFVLGEQAHREFMTRSGLLQALRTGRQEGEGIDGKARWLRRAHRSSPIEGDLNHELCRALVELGAPAVTVGSGSFARRHLRSIPAVKDAVREAWLFPQGLERQVEAASSGEEIPAWPVVILAETDGGDEGVVPVWRTKK